MLTKFDEPKKASTLATDESRILRHIKPFARQEARPGRHVRRHRAVPSRRRGWQDCPRREDRTTRACHRRGRPRCGHPHGRASGRCLRLRRAAQATARQPSAGRAAVQGRAQRALPLWRGDGPPRRGFGFSEVAWRASEEAQAAWLAAGRPGRPPTQGAEAEDPSATNAIRLLLLTGMRKSEVLELQWRHVDAEHGYLRLPKSKTAQKGVPVGEIVIEFLLGLPRLAGQPFCVPRPRRGQAFRRVAQGWERLRMRAGLQDVRLHDLRHSFGAAGASSGNSLLLLGSILGHAIPRPRSGMRTSPATPCARPPIRSRASSRPHSPPQRPRHPGLLRRT